MSILSTEDFTRPDLEEIINTMTADEALENLHNARKRVLDDPGYEPNEHESRASILLARKIRSMRESGKRATSKKEPAAPKPLDDLLDF